MTFPVTPDPNIHQPRDTSLTQWGSPETQQQVASWATTLQAAMVKNFLTALLGAPVATELETLLQQAATWGQQVNNNATQALNQLFTIINGILGGTGNNAFDFNTWLQNVESDASNAWTNLQNFFATGNWADLTAAWNDLLAALGGTTVAQVQANAQTWSNAWTEIDNFLTTGSWSSLTAGMQDLWQALFGSTSPPTTTSKVLQTAVQDLGDAWTALFGSSSNPTTTSQVLQSAVQDLENAWTALFGSSSIPTTSSQVLQTSVTSATGQTNLQKDIDAVFQPFTSINNLTSPTAWQNAWSGLEGLLGVSIAGTNDVQKITASNSNSFTITFDGVTTTGSASNGYSASAMQSFLSTIPALSGNISVTGTGPWSVEFLNALGGAPQPLMSSSTTGITVTVVHTTPGTTGLSSTSAPTQMSGNQIASLSTAAASGSSLSNDLQSHLDNVVAQLLGVSVGSAQSTANAASALNNTYNTLQNVASMVQTLSTQQTGTGQSGKSYTVNFNQYPNGAFSEAPFTITYSGSGTGFLDIQGGNAVWETNNATADRSVVAVYNGGQTDTDYQELRATIAGYPGIGAKNYACVRMNSAGTTYVYGVVYMTSSWQLQYELGCYVNGTKTVFETGNAPLGMNFTLVAGVDGNPYRFQGVSGNTLVFDYTDSASTSQVGTSFRYWGFRSDTANNGQNAPGSASYVGCCDNSPASVTGSGIRQHRSLGNYSVTLTPGANGLPGGFFDITDRSTSDITNASNSITVGYAGWYAVTIRIPVASANTSTGQWCCSPMAFRNGSADTVGSPGIFGNYATFQAFPQAIFGGMVVYCNAGDVLTPGYYIELGSGASATSLTFTGEASGVGAYWEIALANRSWN